MLTVLFLRNIFLNVNSKSERSIRGGPFYESYLSCVPFFGYQNCDVIKDFTRTLRLEVFTYLKILANACFFTVFLTKLINMIIKIQSIIYMNAQKFNTGFTSFFNIRYLDVNWNLRTSNQMIFISIGF